MPTYRHYIKYINNLIDVTPHYITATWSTGIEPDNTPEIDSDTWYWESESYQFYFPEFTPIEYNPVLKDYFENYLYKFNTNTHTVERV